MEATRPPPEAAGDGQCEALHAMLHLAERMIQSKEHQNELLREVVTTNTRVLASQDAKLEELEQKAASLMRELQHMRLLFDQFFSRTEAVRSRTEVCMAKVAQMEAVDGAVHKDLAPSLNLSDKVFFDGDDKPQSAAVPPRVARVVTKADPRRPRSAMDCVSPHDTFQCR